MTLSVLEELGNDAWVGRQGHQSTVKDWLWAVHKRCPTWRRQWQDAINLLRQTRSSNYRGHTIQVDESMGSFKVGAANGMGPYALMFWYDESMRPLFMACHADIIAMVSVLAGAARENDPIFQPLVQRLSLLFPDDPAWGKALRHRLGAINAAARRSKVQMKGFQQLLAERHDSMVLVRQGDSWMMRNGAPVARTLNSSRPIRRQAIETLLSLPGLQRMEMPRLLNFDVVAKIASHLQRAMLGNHPLVVQAIAEGRTWNLAIRRIQSLGLNGCYDAATHTVIVDPRHLNSMHHEVCHWLLGHGVTPKEPGLLKQQEQEVERIEQELFWSLQPDPPSLPSHHPNP